MANRRCPKFSERRVQRILELICDGLSLRQAASSQNITDSTFLKWVAQGKVDSEQYTRAMAVRAELYAEQIIEIADESVHDYQQSPTGPVFNSEHVQRSKLRVDSRKWLLSKLLPKKYGEKIDVGLSGPGGGPIRTENRELSAEEAAARYRDMLNGGDT